MSSSFSFVVSQVPSQSDLAPGTTNDAVENVLRKFLNPTLKGTAYNAMIAAFAAGDATNWDNAQSAFDQLFISSSSGSYLDRRTSDYGEVRPASVGMADDLYRKLAIIKKTKKLTQEAFLEVLEVFYGADAVRASSTASISEPYSLNDQDTLVLLLDEKFSITVTFERTTFASISGALALEVASAINRALNDAGSQAYAISYADPTTGDNFVRIYSGSLGLSSSVRVVGGSGQRALQFPTPLFTGEGFTPTSWVVSKSPAAGLTRFTGGGGVFDLNVVQPGDLAYIFSNDPTDPFVVAGIQGVFPIENVDTYYLVETPLAPRQQYFEVAFPNPPTGTYLQSEFNALMFFRPTKRTIYDQPRHVIVNQSGKVVLPATTQAVTRQPGTGAYLKGQTPINISSLVRTPDGTVTVTTVGNHGMSVGDQAIVDSVQSSGAAPPVTAGTPSGAFSGGHATGTTDASIQSMSSTSDTVAAAYHRVARTAEGLLLLVSGLTQSAPGTTAAIANAKVFEVTSDTVLGNGGRQIAYKWTDLTTHAQTVGRREAGASTLNDGRIIVTGGTQANPGTDTGSLNAWDLYTYTNSPAQNTMTSGTLPSQRAGHGQCTLGNGTALIAGGFDNSGTLLATAATFDPTSATWTTRGSLAQARKYLQLVALQDGSALAIGGVTASNPTNTCERYNATAHTWSNTGAMSFARYDAAALVLPNGRVLVAGGTGGIATQGSLTNALASCELFDPSTSLWAPLPPMSVARVRPTLVYLATKNAVVVAGGGSTVVEMLDLTSMRWSKSRAALGSGLAISAGAIAATDTLLVAGGIQNANNTVVLDYVVLPGSDVIWMGGLNRPTSIASVPSATSFTYLTTDNDYRSAYVSAAAGATVTPSKAQPAPAGVPGPFSYDTKTGLSVTQTVATLGQVINGNQSYSTFELDTGSDANPALLFPDQLGYLVFDFGFAGQVGPVKYLGRFDNTALLLDASFKFPISIASGVTVTLLQSNSPFEPPQEANPLPGNLYVTGSAAGRVAAEAALDDIQAAGIQITKTILYPGDRGLGNEGDPATGAQKLSDATEVWGGDDLDTEIAAIREGD